jgi:hypothetical protein
MNIKLNALLKHTGIIILATNGKSLTKTKKYMSRKQIKHLIQTNYAGIADKIKKAQKKTTTRKVSRGVNSRTS